MIKVDRARVPLPPDLAGRLASEQEKLNEQYRLRSEGRKSSQQRNLDFVPPRATKPTLRELFDQKCAYCESPLLTESGDIENFRPRSTVSDESRGPSGPGYFWLAYVWENLLIACGNCNRLYKRNTFPIAGSRAKPFDVGDALRGELPLLIDPCDDEPADFFWFDEGGRIAVAPEATRKRTGGRREAPRGARAETTIRVLGLNRPELVSARAKIRREIESVMRSLTPATPRATRVLQGLVGREQPYRAAATQWLTELALDSRRQSWRRLPLEQYLPAHGAIAAVVQRVVERRKAAKRAGRTPDRPTPPPPAPSATPTEPTTAAPPIARPAFITRIEIRNFKGIKRLDLSLPVRDSGPALAGLTSPAGGTDAPPTPARAGWYVLLGENSVGKSSVLEAVALALMGRERLQQLVADGRIATAKLVHQPPADSVTTTRRAACSIRLALEPAELGEIHLRITPSGFRFVSGGDPVPTLIRGYGYVRLLPRREEWDPVRATGSLTRCDNLFDPRAPLCDAERWMASLPFDERQTSPFDIAARTILALLPGSTLAGAVPETEADVAESYLRPTPDGRVVMVLKQRELSLDQLSAGYQSVIALAADIISGIAPERLFDMRECPGIVLLDEIGTQLHPRWRMRAISDLRRAFPGMQFIATTHEPLCLKGVAGREVAVLRRLTSGDDIVAITDGIHDPRAMRVDQLLTSPLFGLDSTIDPDVDRLFQEYFALLARGDRLTPAERERRRELERALAPHRGLGYTRSDQIVYALLEEYLATEGAQTAQDAAHVPADVRRRIFDIWQTVGAHRRQAP